MNTITDKLAAALRDCYKLACNCHRDELPTAIIMTASKAIAEYEAARVEEYPQKAVAWARPVYAKPVGAPEAVKGEMVDVEFRTRPEKPEGEGWRPLVVAAKSQTERTTQVDDDAGKDFFVVVAAFVLIVLGTVFLLFLK